jgi:hypothetical protein
VEQLLKSFNFQIKYKRPEPISKDNISTNQYSKPYPHLTMATPFKVLAKDSSKIKKKMIVNPL